MVAKRSMRGRKVRRTKRAVRRHTKLAGRKGGASLFLISFRNAPAPLHKVFGKQPLTPQAMTKKLWAYVQKQNRRLIVR